jgi:hypothetical protein
MWHVRGPIKKAQQGFAGNPEKKKLGKYRRRWKNNYKKES